MPGKKEFSNSQVLGVDRIIYLENGKCLTVEEKVRTRVYDDVLLEYISNDQTNRPGWIERELTIDYLAYGFLPNKTVYLFDWNFLRRAWHENKEDWKERYHIAKAPNKTYTTYSVCVPIDIVKQECQNASIIKL
jgi:hypothetical protein